MALFRPYERTTEADRQKLAKDGAPAATPRPAKGAKPSTSGPSRTPADPAGSGKVTVVRRGYTPKKGRPTPSRDEAETARQQRITPVLSAKERKKQAREASRTARLEAFKRQDEEPTKTLLRDYIDARWTATEFMIPVMLVLLALNIVFARSILATQVISGLVLVVFAVWIANVAWVWRGFKQAARERLTTPKFTGLLMYANGRMMTIRRFRNPGARIPRGGEF